MTRAHPGRGRRRSTEPARAAQHDRLAALRGLRHYPEPARHRAVALRRASRAVAAARRPSGAAPRPPWRRSCASSARSPSRRGSRARSSIVGDYRVPAGTLLTLSTAAANHDPAAHDAPDRFDITAHARAPAHLRRRAALLPRRQPGAGRDAGGAGDPGAAPRDVRIDGEVAWRRGTGIFGPTTLPLRFDPTTTQVGERAGRRTPIATS